MVDSFRTTKSVCCLSNSSSLHKSIKGSRDLLKIRRALKDRLINFTFYENPVKDLE